MDFLINVLIDDLPVIQSSQSMSPNRIGHTLEEIKIPAGKFGSI